VTKSFGVIGGVLYKCNKHFQQNFTSIRWRVRRLQYHESSVTTPSEKRSGDVSNRLPNLRADLTMLSHQLSQLPVMVFHSKSPRPADQHQHARLLRTETLRLGYHRLRDRVQGHWGRQRNELDPRQDLVRRLMGPSPRRVSLPSDVVCRL
jgi:hypothetical protein